MTVKIKADQWHNPPDGMIERETILETLDKARIFSVEKTDDGTFMFQESCDFCFGAELTRKQVLMLANELRAMAGEPGMLLPEEE